MNGDLKNTFELNVVKINKETIESIIGKSPVMEKYMGHLSDMK